MAQTPPSTATAPPSTAIGANTQIKRKYNVDPLNLHGADNPNTVLSAIILTGANYFSWIKSIKLSLQAKVKLGFLDGTCAKPDDEDGATQWMVVDAMVRSWILNTIAKEIRANFEGTVTTQDLWEEVKARYEGNNGPTQYGLARDISTIQQGNLTAEEYYSKIRLYWEEMTGYPDWWKQPKDKRRNTQQNQVHAAIDAIDAPMDGENNGPSMEDFNIFKSYWKTMQNNCASSSQADNNLYYAARFLGDLGRIHTIHPVDLENEHPAS